MYIVNEERIKNIIIDYLENSSITITKTCLDELEDYINSFDIDKVLKDE